MKTQRIIDAHVHIGRSLNFDMKETDVLEAMKKYNIEKVLVSNSESAEADHDQKLLPQDLQISQVKSLEKSIPKHIENKKSFDFLNLGIDNICRKWYDENLRKVLHLKNSVIKYFY